MPENTLDPIGTIACGSIVVSRYGTDSPAVVEALMAYVVREATRQPEIPYHRTHRFEVQSRTCVDCGLTEIAVHAHRWYCHA